MNIFKILLTANLLTSLSMALADDNGYTSYCGVAKKVTLNDMDLSLTIQVSQATYKLHNSTGDLVEKKKKMTIALEKHSYEEYLTHRTLVPAFLLMAKERNKTPYLCVAKVIADNGDENIFFGFSFASIEEAEANLHTQF